MRARITLSVATIALGAVVLSVPAFAQTYVYSNVSEKRCAAFAERPCRRHRTRSVALVRAILDRRRTHQACGVFERSEKWRADFAKRPCCWPEFVRRTGPGLYRTDYAESAKPAAYSNVRPSGAPISPNGLAAGPNSFGGPRLSGQLSPPVLHGLTARFGVTRTGLFYSPFHCGVRLLRNASMPSRKSALM